MFNSVSRLLFRNRQRVLPFQHFLKLIIGIFLYLSKKSQVFVSNFLFNFELIGSFFTKNANCGSLKGRMISFYMTNQFGLSENMFQSLKIGLLTAFDTRSSPLLY